MALSHVIYCHQPSLEWPYRSQAGSLTDTIPASTVDKILVSFDHVVDSPLWIILQPVSKNHVKQGSGYGVMHGTWPHYLKLFTFIAYSEDWTLGFSTLRLNSGLSTKFPHHILLISPRYSCSNTKSLRTSDIRGNVSEQRNSVHPTATVWNRSLIGCQAEITNTLRWWEPVESFLCAKTLDPIYNHQVSYNYRSN